MCQMNRREASGFEASVGSYLFDSQGIIKRVLISNIFTFKYCKVNINDFKLIKLYIIQHHYLILHIDNACSSWATTTTTTINTVISNHRIMWHTFVCDTCHVRICEPLNAFCFGSVC